MICGDLSKAKIISDLSCAAPSSALSLHGKPGHWRIIDYETQAGLKGRLLHAGPETNAAPVSIPLNVHGWHAISIGFWPGHLWVDVHDPYGVWLKLTSDVNYVFGTPSPEDSTRNAIIQECFWKYADIRKDDMLHIAQQVHGCARSASIAFIKLTPLREPEIESIKSDRASKANRRMIVTNDGHGLFYGNRPTTAHEIEAVIEPLRHTDVGRLFWCLGAGGDVVTYNSHVGTMCGRDVSDFPRPGDRYLVESMRDLRKRGIDPLKIACDYAHSIGIEFHVSVRMGAFAIFPPYDEVFTSPTYLQHPEWRCVDKDGTPVARLSYAFEGVRQRVRDLFREAINYGVDGISLLYTRGAPFLLYEQPLLDGFAAEHGKDPRRLEDHDQTWLRYRAGIMTDFIRSLRRELDQSGPASSGKRREISAHVLNNAQNNLFYALDIETWIDEGLVDALVPCSWWKQDWQSGQFEDVDRAYYSNMCRGKKTKWYAAMSCWWDPKYSIEYARQVYASGASGLCLWDHNGADHVWKWWRIISRLGHRDELAALDPDDTGACHHALVSVGGYRMDRYSAYWCY